MKLFWAVLLLFNLSLSGCIKSKDRKENAMNSAFNTENGAVYRGDAPEFPEGLDWLNTSRPLRISELKGKIILLDFWTYCCINCMHIIPDLKKLEAKYPAELVVIGVHSAKFLNEQDTDNIRQAILRYEIEHPVVNDRDFKIWQQYGANAWPTAVLIDPEGNIAAKRAGEGVFDAFDKAISGMIDKFNPVIDTARIIFDLEKNSKPKGLLNFPGKVLADEKNERLFITDSNNNRIIITTLDGRLIDIIGSGKESKEDGSFENAGFFHPQGLALDGNYLYIADTENHLIRKAGLKERIVETVAGTGKQVYDRSPEGKAGTQGLNSPWDLVINNGILYIAMAGPHQLWAMDLSDGEIRLHAGSGRENIIDGSLKDAALAQPSGITTDGSKLYFADSEVSAVRSAEISPKGRVRTIIGHGLFEFGDKDGDAEDARFQHPLGITYLDGKIYLADTYNNKIKVIDPLRRTSKTYAGTGKSGRQDGKLLQSTFDEPGGITYAKGKLYVADTNNDLVRLIDMKSGTVSTLTITGLEKMKKPMAFNRQDFKGEVVEINDVDLSSLDKIEVKFRLPVGYKVNTAAPNQMRLFTEDGNVSISHNISEPEFSLDIKKLSSRKKIFAEAVVYYCRKDNEGVCLIKDILYEINSSRGGRGSLVITYNLPEAKP